MEKCSEQFQEIKVSGCKSFELFRQGCALPGEKPEPDSFQRWIDKPIKRLYLSVWNLIATI